MVINIREVKDSAVVSLWTPASTYKFLLEGLHHDDIRFGLFGGLENWTVIYSDLASLSVIDKTFPVGDPVFARPLAGAVGSTEDPLGQVGCFSEVDQPAIFGGLAGPVEQCLGPDEEQ